MRYRRIDAYFTQQPNYELLCARYYCDPARETVVWLPTWLQLSSVGHFDAETASGRAERIWLGLCGMGVITGNLPGRTLQRGGLWSRRRTSARLGSRPCQRLICEQPPRQTCYLAGRGHLGHSGAQRRFPRGPSVEQGESDLDAMRP